MRVTSKALDWGPLADIAAAARELQHPLGLTPAQWREAPHSADAAALAFDTRKRIDQRQAGLRWQSAYATGREITVALWHASRDIEQFLAIPVAVQNAPSHAGGVVAPERSRPIPSPRSHSPRSS